MAKAIEIILSNKVESREELIQNIDRFDERIKIYDDFNNTFTIFSKIASVEQLQNFEDQINNVLSENRKDLESRLSTMLKVKPYISDNLFNAIYQLIDSKLITSLKSIRKFKNMVLLDIPTTSNVFVADVNTTFCIKGSILNFRAEDDSMTEYTLCYKAEHDKYSLATSNFLESGIDYILLIEQISKELRIVCLPCGFASTTNKFDPPDMESIFPIFNVKTVLPA